MSFTYEGLVLTSIDMRDGDGPGKVEFDNEISGKKDDSDAVFIKNIKVVREEGGGWFSAPKKIYEADLVNLDEANSAVDGMGKKPLLCIHGFNVEPDAHLTSCNEAVGKFEKFALIPVIWPSEGSTTSYGTDQDKNTVGAGKAFKTLSKIAAKFPNKSLMAHSMGNRVLRMAASENFQFDNIFMVAADVDNDLFQENYIKDKSDQGLKISSMLSDKGGKIYVAHNRLDFALLPSSTIFANNYTRLGVNGAAHRDGIHPAIKGKIENMNANESLSFFNKASHSYALTDFMVKYYESKFKN